MSEQTSEHMEEMSLSFLIPIKLLLFCFQTLSTYGSFDSIQVVFLKGPYSKIEKM